MKIDVVLRGGRKKDFWDLHELMDTFSFGQMLDLHKKRHSYVHDRELIKKSFSEFTKADEDFDPICLSEKYCEIIKLDMIDFANND